MTHIDLFSGIGGFSLASHWCGIETVQFVEYDPFCQKVLAKNFPGVPIHGDIKTFNGEQYAGRVDIITGGFPCQPFSVAGLQRGKEDDRYLWKEMLRVIHEVKPAWVIGENVIGIINLALDEVCTDLESEGYEVQPIIIPACAVNAPHRRDRVWIIAYTESVGHRGSSREECGDGRERILPGKQGRCEVGCKDKGCDCEPNTDTNSERFKTDRRKYVTTEEVKPICETTGNSESSGQQGGVNGQGKKQYGGTGTRGFGWEEYWVEVASELCRMDDGVSRKLDTPRIKALGNAIVPQVAYELFRVINEL